MHTISKTALMKLINWNREKNEWQRKNRGICFEDILFYLDRECLIDDIEHPNQEKYGGQRMMVLNIDNYIHLVPYVETADEIL